MSTSNTAGRDILALAPVLDLAGASALKDSLGEAILAHAGVVLDGANVERVSTPAVQVLLAAARTCTAEGRAFTVRQPSHALHAAFDDLGLADELKRWSSI